MNQIDQDLKRSSPNSTVLALILGCTFMASLSSCSTATNQQNQPAASQGRESQFEQFVETHLMPFWGEYADQRHFENNQGLTIHYVQLLHPKAKHTVVLSPGRVEGYLKYQELAYDLFEQGFSVFIIDHQGQGLSSRRLSNNHKGYVADFDDYVRDLHQLITLHVMPKQRGELFLLAHSMGSAIGLRYLQSHPDVFSKAVLSSPMWGFRSGAVPEFIAKGLVEMGHWISGNISEESPYFLGGKDYEPTPFEDNELTDSPSRYEFFRKLYQEQPTLQLGGITFAWLDASIQALEKAQNELNKVSIPVLVLQAEQESIIDNEAQDHFCQQLAELGQPCIGGKPHVIAGAKHEIFIETDDKREKALGLVFEYFD